MDESVIARMKEVEAEVKKLDPEVRGAAFTMMERYILGGTVQPRVQREEKPQAERGGGDGGGHDHDGLESFFTDREISKPADAVYAVAGYEYSVYGSEPFTIEEMRDLANNVGLTLPQDPGATLRMAKRNGKKLVRNKGPLWAPTTGGELVLKEMFDIKKGRTKRSTASASEK